MLTKWASVADKDRNKGEEDGENKDDDVNEHDSRLREFLERLENNDNDIDIENNNQSRRSSKKSSLPGRCFGLTFLHFRLNPGTLN